MNALMQTVSISLTRALLAQFHDIKRVPDQATLSLNTAKPRRPLVNWTFRDMRDQRDNDLRCYQLYGIKKKMLSRRVSHNVGL